MARLLENVLTASFHGSIVIAAVLLLRLVLKKAPRKYICWLWLLVFARLLMPFEIESKLSLQPETVVMTEVQQPEDGGYLIFAGGPVDLAEEVSEAVSEARAAAQAEENHASVEKKSAETAVEGTWSWAAVMPWLWAAGVCVMAAYSLVSYLRLRKRVEEAVHSGGAWECAGLETAFILGFFRPRIYVPFGLNEEERRFILQHERTHLDRGDPWFKLVSYIALTVHWFNPLVWTAYALLCRDMEMACDEQVVREMALEERKAYSRALLSCSVNRRSFGACPVAFGEISVKKRIQNVLNYRKPAFWLTVLAVIVIVFVAVCLLTSPISDGTVEKTPPTNTSNEESTAVMETAGESKRERLQNPYTDYECRYEGRDREWEEDIVYLADMFLNNHLKLTDKYYFATHAYKEKITAYLVNENALYDEEMRTEFIGGIDELLEEIPEMEDTQIRYALQRIVAGLDDASSCVVCDSQEYFPVMMEELEREDGLGYYAVRIPNAYRDLIYARLTAVNGIPVEQVVDRLRAYVPSENRYFEETRIVSPSWESLLVRKEALQAAGILGWNEDQADFTFVLEDGTVQTVTLAAITSEEYDVSGMTRVDFYAKRLYLYAEPDQYFWYETQPETGTVYARIAYCLESKGDFATFSRELLEEMEGSDTYRKLVIDLRYNTGGSYPISGIDDFYDGLSRLEDVKVFVLINGGTAAGGISIAAKIRDNVPGAVLVGTPAGQPLNVIADTRRYTTENREVEFYISTKYWMNAAENEGDTLMPDAVVYQTLEDHKNGVDSMLRYVQEKNG